MAFKHTVTRRVIVDGREIGGTKEIEGSGLKSVNESIADAQTDKQVNYTLDVSACKSFFMVSDQNITVETNNGAAPVDTITLVADEPYYWNSDSYDTFLLGTDVTALFITNASGAAATLEIESLEDATP